MCVRLNCSQVDLVCYAETKEEVHVSWSFIFIFLLLICNIKNGFFCESRVLELIRSVFLQKNRSLLRAYYMYSAGLCILTILLTGMLIGMSAQRWFTLTISMRTLTLRLLDFSGYFINIGELVGFLRVCR